jgi:NTE family protein
MHKLYTTEKGRIPPEMGRIGIALGGGMARGFAHIGVLRVLAKHNIYPTIVAGTSIGSLVGACYLANKMPELEDWARSLNRRKILSYIDLRVRGAGLIAGNKLSRILTDYFGDMGIEDLPHPLSIVATDLATGHETWLRQGNLVEAMQASYALPGIFPPVQIQGRNLVDGALVNPCPISVCRAMGAHLTIAVDLHADMIGKATKPGQNYQTVAGFDLFDETQVTEEQQKPFLLNPFAKKIFGREPGTPSLFGVMVSSLGIIQDRLTRSRLAGDPPDIHIKPMLGHIGMLEFEKADDLIRLGEEAAERMLPDIKAGINLFVPAQQRPDYIPPEDVPPQNEEENLF